MDILWFIAPQLTVFLICLVIVILFDLATVRD